ncbi:FRG domain-containing protein [Magnetospira sp. QH-2]|uniref:FRG domain-containing protein n=1 Tax=Magnetospira sp. (strain QH-2) TaxID=1288970 RepID=UPI0005FA2FC2|nr:FRG domain-containing protein [Magnetospira sp. QH-2]
MVEQHVARNFAELHQVFKRFESDSKWMHRGHRDVSKVLMPKAGRSPFFHKHQEDFFRAWQRRAVEFVPNPPPDDWEWLAVAQHHGFSTKLLDWSGNPLIACFFAVFRNDGTTDACVHSFKPRYRIRPQPGLSPFNIEPGVWEYRPSAFSPRISRQLARFSVHQPADLDLLHTTEFGALETTVIPRDYVDGLLTELDHYGYNAATVFPDLDGLSEHMIWIAGQRDLRQRFLEDDKELGI